MKAQSRSGIHHDNAHAIDLMQQVSTAIAPASVARFDSRTVIGATGKPTAEYLFDGSLRAVSYHRCDYSGDSCAAQSFLNIPTLMTMPRAERLRLAAVRRGVSPDASR
jgi:hypothetical protein